MSNIKLISINNRSLNRSIKIPIDKINSFERDYHNHEVVVHTNGYSYLFNSINFDIEDIYTKLVDAYEEKA